MLSNHIEGGKHVVPYQGHRSGFLFQPRHLKMQPPVETQSPRNLAHFNIFTDPLFWTSRHLDAVGCRFEDHEALPMELLNNEHSSDGHHYLDQGSWLIEGSGLESDVEQLARSCAPLVKYYALINILDCEESPFEGVGLVSSTA
jgi:hypothetical protein